MKFHGYFCKKKKKKKKKNHYFIAISECINDTNPQKEVTEKILGINIQNIYKHVKKQGNVINNVTCKKQL